MQETDKALYNANRNKSDNELRKTYNRLRNKAIKQTRKLNICVKNRGKTKKIRSYFGYSF